MEQTNETTLCNFISPLQWYLVVTDGSSDWLSKWIETLSIWLYLNQVTNSPKPKNVSSVNVQTDDCLVITCLPVLQTTGTAQLLWLCSEQRVQPIGYQLYNPMYCQSLLVLSSRTTICTKSLFPLEGQSHFPRSSAQSQRGSYWSQKNPLLVWWFTIQKLLCHCWT